MKSIINSISDINSFYEINPEYGKSLVVGFCRFEGHTCGIVANQPSYNGGLMDNQSCIKASRFINFLDCYNIPLITLVDTAGFKPGYDIESNGMIRNGGKLLFSYAKSKIPKITIVIRKAYGGAFAINEIRH